MRQWEPVTERYREHARKGALHEGIPPWLRQPVRSWILRHLGQHSRRSSWLPTGTLELLSANLRQELDWSFDEQSATRDLLDRMEDDPELGIEALNYLVSTRVKDDMAASVLELLLRDGGSAWMVGGFGEDEGYWLERRVDDRVRERYAAVSSKDQAGQHLTAAWENMYGVEPNPDVTYDRAIKAVEAAARPVISPDNDRATLGTIIRDFKAKPTKWHVALGRDEDQGRQALLGMMESVWKGHDARHGSDDPDDPAEMEKEPTESALHVAITLVHLFTNGLVSRATDQSAS